MTDQDEANIWFQEDFVLPERTNQLGKAASGQITHIMPRMSIRAYRFAYQENGPLHQLILLDLSDTAVSPGTLAANQDDKRGAFTDRVEVWAGFADERAFLVKNSYPDTTTEGGSVSTSVSYDLGAGWMGKSPMFNANWTISAGVTQSIPDFEILSNVAGSGGSTLEHIYRLALVGGAEYQHPIDAVNTEWEGSIHPLPPKACADFRLVSSALFYTPEPLQSIERLIVTISHRVMYVEKTLAGEGMIPLLPKYDPSRDDQPQVSTLSCGLGYLRVDTIPFINQEKWAFDVDLKSDTGGIKQVQL